MLKFASHCPGTKLSFSFLSWSLRLDPAPKVPSLGCQSFLKPRRQHLLEVAEISMESDGFLIKILGSICLTFSTLESIFLYCHSTTPCHSQSVIIPMLQMKKLRLEKVACLFQSDTVLKRQLKDQNWFSYDSDSRAFSTTSCGDPVFPSRSIGA